MVVGVLAPSRSHAETPAVRYDGHRVLRVEPRSTAQLERLLSLADVVWTERPGVGVPVDVRVSPSAAAALDVEGFDYRVRIADVQEAIDAEHARLSAPPDPLGAPSAWFSEFRDLEAIEAYMDELASLHPEVVTLEPVGESFEGRPIRALRLSSPATTDTAAMLLTGTLHAREWLSPMTVLCIAEAMAEGYDVDPETTALLDALDLLVVPMVNPDGYVYSWTTDRYWRKNRREDHGVDLNRNFSHAWGGLGSSPYPYDENFRGEEAMSEPETAALARYVDANERLVAYIDMHAYGEVILHPWGHQYSPAPDAELLSDLAIQMSDAIVSVHGVEYDAIQGSILYPASGVSDDWSYGQRGLMGFTIELRGDDFVIPPSQIVPTCEESLEAVWALAQWARDQSEPLPIPEDDQSATWGSTADGAGLTSNTGGGLLTAGDDEDGDSGLPGGTEAPAGDGDDRGSGCACRSRGAPGAGSWALLVLLGLGAGGLRSTRRRRPF